MWCVFMVCLWDVVADALLPYTSTGEASIDAGALVCPNKVYTVFISRLHLLHSYPFNELKKMPR